MANSKVNLMGANARAIEAGRFGVDEALVHQFVSMNGLAAAHGSKPARFAGACELYPGDSLPMCVSRMD